MEVEFRIISYSTKEWKEAVKLREAILRKPIGSKFTGKELEEEENMVQVVGFQKRKIVASAVLVPLHPYLKIQRVVVQGNLRNANIGSRMMAFCELYAGKEGFQGIFCHARQSAIRFYIKNGYSEEGDHFEEDGVPHMKMVKSL